MGYSLAYSKAILVLVFVGDKVAQGHYDFVPSKIVAESLNIPAPTVVKIMQDLSRAGLIETREGARGGMRLARPAVAISLADVFNAVETGRPLFRRDFDMKVQGRKPERAEAAISDVFLRAETAMRTALAETTIGDLIAKLNS
jgi:Rrf2 family protein